MGLKIFNKYLIIFIICFFLNPIISNAECSYERQAELSKIASNVQIAYSYENDMGNPVFSVNIINITNDIYVLDNYGNSFKTFESSFNYSKGTTVNFEIYSNDSSCYGEKLLTKYINIPEINQFALTEECEKYPTFKLCRLWLDTSNISYDDFRKSIENYSNKIENENIIYDGKSNNIIYDFMIKNKNTLILVLICILFLIGIFLIKKFR